MPKKLGDLLSHVAKVAGVDENDASLVALLQNENVFKAEIDDDTANKLMSNLFSEASAKAKLEPAIKAEALNGVNTHVLRLAEKTLALDADTVKELEKEKNPGKQVELMITKLQAINEAKSKSKDPDVEALRKEINSFKEQLAAKEVEKNTAVEAEKTRATEEMTGLLLRQTLADFKYIAPEGMDPEIIRDTASNALNRALAAEGLKIKNDGGQLKLVTKDGTDHYVNSVKQEVKSYAEGIFSKNKMLQTTAALADPAGGGGGNPTVIPGKGNKLNAVDANILSDIDKQIAEHTKA